MFVIGFSGGSAVKNLSAMQGHQETWVHSLGREDPLEEGMAAHSSIRIPIGKGAWWALSIGSRVGCDWSDLACRCACRVISYMNSLMSHQLVRVTAHVHFIFTCSDPFLPRIPLCALWFLFPLGLIFSAADILPLHDRKRWRLIILDHSPSV